MYRRDDGTLIVSATDLVGFLACGHLTQLERAAVAGLVKKPIRDDPEIELLRRRGYAHEQRYIEQLRAQGRDVTELPEKDELDERLSYEVRAARTMDAMRRGDDVIFQATVFDGRWVGHPDFLLRTPGASVFGDYHYEVADTKLAHSVRASALIQICSYVDQIERNQGVRPENAQVVLGGATIKIERFRTAEMMAYYRLAKARFEEAVDDALAGGASYPPAGTYPDPVGHCDVCRWFYVECRQRWRNDDALPQVAGIARKQREMLTRNAVATMTAFSELPPPIHYEGMRQAHSASMWKLREQARLQVASKGRDVPEWELLDPDELDGELVPNRGLAALPPPSSHDLFFDIEGDPFAFWEGLEYLFGIWDGREYRQIWAMDRDLEKRAFQEVMDLFHGWWREHPDMHVYHYGVYEPSRLKHLAGRHATRQQQLDDLLRGGVFVDLFRVVRQGLRIGTESYSIKRLEPLYGYEREIELRDANSSIVEFEKLLEVGDPSGELKTLIAGYNRDDCVSTQLLRGWLEDRRPDAAVQFGRELPRPRAAQPPDQAKPPSDWEVRLHAVFDRLTAGLPTDPEEIAQHPTAGATWLLANMLDWHRREDKASWWTFFSQLTMSDEELLEEHEPIARLKPAGVEVLESGKRRFTYTFPPQEHKVGNRSDLHDPRLPPFEEGDLGKGVIDKDKLTLTITRAADWAGPDPTAVVPHDRIPIEGLQDSLLRVGDWIAANGWTPERHEYRAVRDLLLRSAPRLEGRQAPGGIVLAGEGDNGGDAARRLACGLDGTTLAIQGPPGSGKTYSGARMILELIGDTSRHRVVGITGSSHKVIGNLLREVWRAAEKEGIAFEALQRVDEEGVDVPPWQTAKTNDKFDRLLASDKHDFRLLAGTVWLWAREKMVDSIDTLFVDEAGQVSLANVVAAGGAARNIVLLGDPQQLDQVLQGSHPSGAERSALGHFLGTAETVPPTKGVFLKRTWRMHPDITAYTSELFYEGRLSSVEGLDRQRVEGADSWSGSGLRWLPLVHDGNTNASPEEAEKVVEIVGTLLERGWRDADGVVRPITADDIRVVSPFNAHRLLIDELLEKAGLRGVPVGTVDKFQGQQAAVSIYTMATSRAEDAPRGLDFLYSLNRLNVATSRAKALAIVVGSAELLNAVPKTPDQLRMVNGLCSFVEAASRPRPAEQLAAK